MTDIPRRSRSLKTILQSNRKAKQPHSVNEWGCFLIASAFSKTFFARRSPESFHALSEWPCCASKRQAYAPKGSVMPRHTAWRAPWQKPSDHHIDIVFLRTHRRSKKQISGLKCPSKIVPHERTEPIPHGISLIRRNPMSEYAAKARRYALQTPLAASASQVAQLSIYGKKLSSAASVFA